MSLHPAAADARPAGRGMGGRCDHHLATRRAAQIFVSVADVQQGRCRGAAPATLNEPAGSLGYTCYLLARQGLTFWVLCVCVCVRVWVLAVSASRIFQCILQSHCATYCIFASQRVNFLILYKSTFSNGLGVFSSSAAGGTWITKSGAELQPCCAHKGHHVAGVCSGARRLSPLCTAGSFLQRWQPCCWTWQRWAQRWASCRLARGLAVPCLEPTLRPCHSNSA